MNLELQVTPLFNISVSIDESNTSHLTLTSPRGVFYHYQLRHAGLPYGQLYPQCLFYIDLDNDDSIPQEWVDQFTRVTKRLEDLLKIQPVICFLSIWSVLEQEVSQNGIIN